MDSDTDEVGSYNSILLGCISYSKKLISCETLTDRTKVHYKSTTKIIDSESIRYCNINFSKIKNRMIVITTTKYNVLQFPPNSIIVQSSLRHEATDKLKLGEMGPVIFLLFLVINPNR